MIIAQRMVNGMESIPLIAIPFFILAGALPGVLLGVSLMVTSYIMAIKYNFPREDWPG